MRLREKKLSKFSLPINLLFLFLVTCARCFLAYADDTISLLSAKGDLKFSYVAPTMADETITLYFHVPISFKEQVPLLFSIDECEGLIDYRFIRLTEPNVIVAARIKKTTGVSEKPLRWTGWVAVKNNNYADYPSNVPMPSPADIPAEYQKWLLPTAVAQTSSPFISNIAASLRPKSGLLVDLTNALSSYCDNEITWDFSHYPISFDAFYALNWGNSCTGHAHAAAALLRANGVPARSILGIIHDVGSMDMHWIIDYYAPSYGWINLESSLGVNFSDPSKRVVVFCSNPEDEFPLFFPHGIDACWHSSDPQESIWTPDWCSAHSSIKYSDLDGSTAQIETFLTQQREIFDLYSKWHGVRLSDEFANALRKMALDMQQEELAKLQAGSKWNKISKLQKKIALFYKALGLSSDISIMTEDFEQGPASWTHGGFKDEWECGEPASKYTVAHSGRYCWGTDLDNTYENNADNWLLSPEIDLTDKASAFLSFWLWNQTEEFQFNSWSPTILDYLWVEVTSDGTNFTPICSKMGGSNNDPAIPVIMGWSRVVLDLFPYIGHRIQVRFRFKSDNRNVKAGAYLDDIQVYGQRSG